MNTRLTISFVMLLAACSSPIATTDSTTPTDQPTIEDLTQPDGGLVGSDVINGQDTALVDSQLDHQDVARDAAPDIRPDRFIIPDDDGCFNGCCPTGPEVCDGIDNDCDGLIDEDLGVLTCGTGACFMMAPVCLLGNPNTCHPAQPTTESCNGIDDDCDGAVDNNCTIPDSGMDIIEEPVDVVEEAIDVPIISCQENACRCMYNIGAFQVECCHAGQWILEQGCHGNNTNTPEGCVQASCALCRPGTWLGCALENYCTTDNDCLSPGYNRCVEGKCTRRGAVLCVDSAFCTTVVGRGFPVNCVPRMVGSTNAFICDPVLPDDPTCHSDVMCPVNYHCNMQSGFCEK